MPDAKSRFSLALAASALLSFVLVGSGGCDDKPAPGSSPPAATPTTPAAPPPTKPASVTKESTPDVLVDELGPLLGSERIDVNAKDWPTRLDAAAAKLGVSQKSVPLNAARNAKTQYVAAVVDALGAAGAVQVEVKTPGRSSANAVLKLTPERAVSPAAAPDCAAVAMVRKDSTSAVWRLKGGVASKFSKGFAGPDLSMTMDGLTKTIDPCPASAWFFSADDNVIWGLTFDLGVAVATANPPTKATINVLLHEAPVAGRAVKLIK